MLQAIIYEGQDKNPEMCRVLLTHEVMCRYVENNIQYIMSYYSSSFLQTFSTQLLLKCFSLQVVEHILSLLMFFVLPFPLDLPQFRFTLSSRLVTFSLCLYGLEQSSYVHLRKYFTTELQSFYTRRFTFYVFIFYRHGFMLLDLI